MSTFTTAEALFERLDDLNYDEGFGTAAVVVNGILWLAYATDPDGKWFFESGDPTERLNTTGEDIFYEPISSDFLRGQIDAHGATIIWPAEVTS